MLRCHDFHPIVCAILTLIWIQASESGESSDGHGLQGTIIGTDSLRGGLHIISPNSSRTVKMKTQGKYADVTYDFDRAEVYWSIFDFDDLGEGEILSANITGGPEQVRRVKSFPGPLQVYGISYDWIGQNIYYAGSITDQVGVCNRQGTACAVLVQDTDTTVATAVDPTRGTMYWTSHAPAIRRAGMDGSSPATIVSSAALANVTVLSLAVDHLNGRLYWVNPEMNSIHSRDLDGGDPRVVISLGSFKPWGLDILGDKVYWTEPFEKRVRSCNKVDGSGLTTVISTPKIFAMAISHGGGQPKGRANPCAGKPCSHLCVITPTNYFSCLCPERFQLSADGKNCTDSSEGGPTTGATSVDQTVYFAA